MTDEKRFYLDEEDRLCIHYDGKILASVGFKETEAIKIVDMLNSLNDENEQLRNIIKQKEKEEKLYAKEILRLNELDKQKNQLNDILGGY